jgi:hypothetical protein
VRGGGAQADAAPARHDLHQRGRHHESLDARLAGSVQQRLAVWRRIALKVKCVAIGAPLA